MNPKLRAAIIAAINAYLQEQEAVTAGPDRNKGWVRQGRIRAMGAAQAPFVRPGRWR